MLKKSALFLFCLLSFVSTAYAQLKLPKLISDGMVLQRDADLTVWGWAESGDTITLEFRGEQYEAVTSDDGRWEIDLEEQSAGGPFSMEIASSSGDNISLSDIMIGDVWVASGQSNMELPMDRVRPLYETEIMNADHPMIRYFEVPKTYDFNTPKDDFDYGQWQRVAPETISAMSAVAYFFARDLEEANGVPVGIILSALGGSPAESWLSEGALNEFPKHYHEMQMFKDSQLIDTIEASDQARNNAWYAQAQQADQGYTAGSMSWADPATDYSDWHTMDVPGYWAGEEIGPVNGVVWFHKEIQIREEDAGKPADLELGRVVDADSVFVNGTFVGSTGYQYPPRWYDVPEGVLREGTNHIVVRVVNTSGNGGFLYDKPYELITGIDTLDLKGPWDYKLGVEMPSLDGPTFIRWKPGGLYNAMISPLLDTSVKGVIWYQGESNAGRPQEYAELFPALIRNWREKWNQPGLPFLYVQLANYMRESDTPTESNWAELREAQRNTLSLPNTGMAVTIDIGEWNDIHPLNKKDVGERLARWARGMVYNEDIVQSGPLVEGVTRNGGRLRLTFSHTGSGLSVEGDELKEFTVAGEDGRFVRASAKIEGDNVIVWSEQVSNPVHVRYAWEDNPADANLYNREGLPASPFEISL